MKKYILSIICMLCLGCTSTWASSIQDMMNQRESDYHLEQGQIIQGKLIGTGLNMLSQGCTMTNDLTMQVNQNVQNALTQIGLTLNKDTAAEYYHTYQQWHEAAATYHDDARYCIAKISAYQLQQRFYDVYQGTQVPVNPVRTNYEYRMSYFDELAKMIQKYSVSADIDPYVKISVANRADVLKLHSITKKVATQMSAMYRVIIVDSLKKMKDDGILTQDDIAVIGPKIIFHYVEQCNELRGLTKVVISRVDNRVVGTKLTNITFNVNLCEDKSYFVDFDKHIKDLIYHELAHYIYYTKDISVNRFTSLCWSGAKNKCFTKDFVTDYSQTSSEEDYAETFQYWYQTKITPKTGSKLSQKFLYFTKMFP